jgi:hypothetical protein
MTVDITSPEAMSASMQFPEYPLSLGQRAIWLLHQAAPENVAYNLSGAVAVPGDTNLDALRCAFQRLAERHPMLRTVNPCNASSRVQT